jgi:hypothetical protein
MRIDSPLGYYSFVAGVVAVLLAVSGWVASVTSPVVGVLVGWILFGQAGNMYLDDLKVKHRFSETYPSGFTDPTGPAARRARLRIAGVGALTSAALVIALARHLGLSLTSTPFLFYWASLVFALGACLRSCTPVLYLLSVARTLTEPVFVLADLASAALLRGPRRLRAYQRVYEAERRLYSAIVGYRSIFTLRSNYLCAGLPKVGTPS